MLHVQEKETYIKGKLEQTFTYELHATSQGKCSVSLNSIELTCY